MAKPNTAKILLLCLAFWLGHCSLLSSKIGYALSGGGARGFAHIGVLKVLEEEGIKPDCISGSSIGAIIGAVYAMGYTPAEIEAICLNLDWADLTRDIHNRKDLYIGQKRWAPYGNAVFELNDAWVPQLPSSVFVGNKINLELFRLLAPASQVKSFEDLPIPFACNATNLITGEAVTFKDGSLMQALRASMSIPSLVKPFEIDDQIYIDGGVSQNMPVDLLHELGAKNVIGIKVNSTLRDDESLNNLVEILDQTINIGITRNLNEQLSACDLLIEPCLKEYSSRDFEHISEIIAAGEQAARENIAAIRAFKATLGVKACETSDTIPLTTGENKFDKNLDTYPIQEIRVHGNQHVSAAKVKEYLNLSAGRSYNTNAIFAACEKAWNSQVFSTIYPNLERADNTYYILHIFLKEKDRKNLALNLGYNSEDKLVAGTVLSLNNYLLKNSRLMAEVKLGGMNELNIDYVKNFGEEWGAYYRIFPYVSEKTIYTYKDHHRTSSVNSLEWGLTSGLGVFAKDIAIAEFFLFSVQNRLYKEISETPDLPRNNLVSGFGVKGYHESLDDYLFPSSGSRLLAKFNFARNVELSDYIYSSFQGKAEAYVPIAKPLSIGLSVDFGSYFNSAEEDKLDPFIICGAGGFMGYSRYETSAPHYQINSFDLLLKPYKRWRVCAGVQSLNYSTSDFWAWETAWEYCYYAGIGYNNSIFPMRLKLAINEQGILNSFLSVGYDIDIFKFSRK